MSFLKLTGEQRVLLKVDDYDYANVLSEDQLNELFTHNTDYQQLRENYCFEPVFLDDLEGSKGKKRLTKKRLIHYCQENCLVSKEHCVAIESGKFSKHRIPRKKKKQLQEMLEKEEGNSFIRFCHHVAQNKQDALCILLHYILQLVQFEIIDLTEAQELLLRGELYYQSIVEEHQFLDEIEETIPETEIDYELSIVDKYEEYASYSFNFHDFLLDKGENIE